MDTPSLTSMKQDAGSFVHVRINCPVNCAEVFIDSKDKLSTTGHFYTVLQIT